MNYISVKEAVKATGKSDKTIRRFLSKAESKAYTERNGNKLFVDVNYLFASYPPLKAETKERRQKVDTDHVEPLDTKLADLERKIAIYEQEIKHKDQLLSEKDGRIMDLQKAMLLLEAPKDPPGQKKKKWWRF